MSELNTNECPFPRVLEFENIKNLPVSEVVSLVLGANESRCLDDPHDRSVVAGALTVALESWTAYRAAVAAFQMRYNLAGPDIVEAVAVVESGHARELVKLYSEDSDD